MLKHVNNSQKNSVNDYIRGSLLYSKILNLKELPEEVYENSYAIPFPGVKVRFPTTQDYTVIFRDYPKNMSIKKVGTYNTNAGRLVFTDRNGIIYVSKASWRLEKALIEAGFRKDEMLFIPFCRGEEPQNLIIYAELKRISVL